MAVQVPGQSQVLSMARQTRWMGKLLELSSVGRPYVQHKRPTVYSWEGVLLLLLLSHS